MCGPLEHCTYLSAPTGSVFIVLIEKYYVASWLQIIQDGHCL